MTELIVTMQHVRTVPGLGPRPGLCARGARAWFHRHGIDWGAFLRDGVPADVLLATGDGLALKVVEWARRAELEAPRG